jgi:peptide/nickel transport system permease protein
MGKYILRRVLITIPVLIGMVFIIFFMLNVVAGDPVTAMMKEKIKPEVRDHIIEQMHLKDPFPIRFCRYVWGALHGDLGTSYKLKTPVTQLIAGAFPTTLKLALLAALFAWAVGIPIGIVSAVRKNTWIDHLFMGFSLFGVSMPVFWIGLILQSAFLHILPISGFDTWKQMILPMVVLGWQSSGTISRLTRSSLLEVMRNDYIRTARAKGLKEIFVISGHALKNAIIPVITMMAIQLASLLSGAVITETIFSIPGIGRLSVDAIGNRDAPLLQGTVIFTAALIIAGNLIADLLYSVIDPRIRVD